MGKMEKIKFVHSDEAITISFLKGYLNCMKSLVELDDEAKEKGMRLYEYADSDNDVAFRMGMYVGGKETFDIMLEYMLGKEKAHEFLHKGENNDGNI